MMQNVRLDPEHILRGCADLQGHDNDVSSTSYCYTLFKRQSKQESGAMSEFPRTEGSEDLRRLNHELSVLNAIAR
ncbi:MAG: hypothetical protein M3N45_09460, partial [Actinomycetota bacterium]|nr:hypothetical protein [Actinomycetota bacterium]